MEMEPSKKINNNNNDNNNNNNNNNQKQRVGFKHAPCLIEL